MKRFLLSVLSITGVAHIARFFNKNRLTILLYHGVAPEESGRGIYNYRGKFVTPAAFEKHLAYFKKHYVILPLDEAVQKLRDGTLPGRALVITFDDGYRNFYEHAYPALKRHGIPATMFLASDFVLEKKPLWVDRLEYAIGKRSRTHKDKAAEDARLREEMKRMPDDLRDERLREIERELGASFMDFAGERTVYAPLSSIEIREMREHSITFGAHTKSHPILSRLTDARIEEELHGSKLSLEAAVGPLSRVFAYPNGQPGDWNEAAERILEREGFVAALTTVEGTNDRHVHPMRLRRIAMDGTDDGPAFAAIASGMRGWLRTIHQYV